MDFSLQTNWVAITGAPSSGKTSVIDELARRGYTTQKETARDVIERHLQEGRTLAEVRRNSAALQREILSEKIASEKGLAPGALVFLDRGMADSITYFRLAGIDTAPAVAASKLFKYGAVFIFDRLPLVRDDVRSEDDALAGKIDEMIDADYRATGYDPIRVPVMSVEKRADFILSRLPRGTSSVPAGRP